MITTKTGQIRHGTFGDTQLLEPGALVVIRTCESPGFLPLVRGFLLSSNPVRVGLDQVSDSPAIVLPRYLASPEGEVPALGFLLDRLNRVIPETLPQKTT